MNMRRNKIKLAIALVFIVAAATVVLLKMRRSGPDDEENREVKPVRGSIQSVVSTTGSVLPKNRLEVKPPVNGRIEEVLVKEGEKVEIGQTLVWMSSTERAALLDAARAKGEEALKYWEDAYKPIALISPIEGEVIVATMQPGQTVTTNDAVVVLSDRLIIRAQVDETDIGKIKEGERANVSLDAYPDVRIEGAVDHIYYESETVNNVTIYKADIVPDDTPAMLRSGMNATVDFIYEKKENALLIPQEAVRIDKDGAWVLVLQADGKTLKKQEVKPGISDDKFIEIVLGLDEDDTVVIKSKKYVLSTGSNTGTNPFLPQRRR